MKRIHCLGDKMNQDNSEQRSILDNMLEGCQIIDHAYKYVYLNRVALQQSHKTKKELIGKTMMECYPGIEETEMFRTLKQCMEQKTPINTENHFTYPNGETSWYELRFEPVQDGVFVLSIDISKRKQAEAHSRYLYQALLAIRNVNQLIVTEKVRENLLQRACDLMVESKGYNHCRIMLLNEQGEVDKIYDTGSSLSKIDVNKKIDVYPCIDKLGANQPTVFTDPVNTCMGCPLYSGASDYAIIGMALSYKEKTFGYLTAAVPSNMTGREEVSLFNEVVGDISYALRALEVEDEKKKAVDALAASEKRYRNLLDSGLDGVTVNILEKIVYVNSRCVEIIGYSEEELIGSSIIDIHAPEYRELVRERTRQRHNGVDVPYYYEVELIRKDGSRLPVSYSVSRIIFDGEPASLTYIRDMTEIKRYERRLAALHDSALELWKADSMDDVFSIARKTLSDILSFDRYGITQLIDDYLVATLEVDGKRHRFHILSRSIVARTARTKKTQFIRDTRKDPDYSKGPRDTACLSEITTPVIVDDKVAAVINVESQQADAFDEQDVILIETLATHMSLAIGHIEDDREKQSFASKLTALHHYAVKSIEASSLKQLTELTIKALHEVLDFEFCELSQVEKDIVKILKSSRPGEFHELPIEGPGIVVRAIKTGMTQNVADIRLDQDYVAGGKRDESGNVFDILSELAVPVKVGEDVRLIINVESTETEAFSWRDQRLTEILATHTAAAYELIQEKERILDYTQKLEMLYLVTEALPESESIGELAGKIEVAIRDIIGFHLASFGLVEGEVLHHRYMWGVDLGEDFILPLDGPGVTVRAVNTGEVQLICDTALEPRHINPEESGGTRSELCAPVKISGKAVAVINIESRNVDEFSQQDVSLLSILAEHVGSTMHNLELRDKEREFSRRLEALSRAGAYMNTADSLEELAKTALAIINEIMEVPFASIGLIENDNLVVIESTGSSLLDFDMPLDGPGVCVRAVNENKTILVKDTRVDPDFVKGSTDSLSELVVPIIIDEQPVGVLNMESLEVGYFDVNHQSLAETLAANVASNIQRLQREEATRIAERKAIREQERAEQAEELEEMKSSFIRTATHEIRTPLTSIKGYTQLGKMKLEEKDYDELDRYLDVILRNSDRLETLSSDLLDIQRLETGRLELDQESIQIYNILDNLALEMKPILDSKNQTLRIIGEDYLVYVDRIRLMQVFVNLVMNASKFSPEGSTITIALEATDRVLSVSVSDEGAGIREEDIPKLFKPFPGIRVKGVKDSTGLGLSICRGLVELHGGEIWAESEGLGKGSKFTFTCPCILGEDDE